MEREDGKRIELGSLVEVRKRRKQENKKTKKKDTCSEKEGKRAMHKMDCGQCRAKRKEGKGKMKWGRRGSVPCFCSTSMYSTHADRDALGKKTDPHGCNSPTCMACMQEAEAK